MTVKKNRHRKILELINNEIIERQEDIVSRLKEMGFKVTQATVSRDIHDLRLIKQTSKAGIQHYVQASNIIGAEFNEKLTGIFSSSVTSVDFAGNIIVVKTLSGMAHAAASAVDALQSRHIVGCIAGDDTICVIMRSADDAVCMSEEFEKMRG